MPTITVCLTEVVIGTIQPRLKFKFDQNCRFCYKPFTKAIDTGTENKDLGWNYNNSRQKLETPKISKYISRVTGFKGLHIVR